MKFDRLPPRTFRIGCWEKVFTLLQDLTEWGFGISYNRLIVRDKFVVIYWFEMYAYRCKCIWSSAYVIQALYVLEYWQYSWYNTSLRILYNTFSIDSFHSINYLIKAAVIDDYGYKIFITPVALNMWTVSTDSSEMNFTAIYCSSPSVWMLNHETMKRPNYQSVTGFNRFVQFVNAVINGGCT